jgi:peptidoglycan/LPS O-acetylase OafA/YrhL
MSKDYLRSIDGLRGIAILLVIMFHLNIVHFGWSGVILFFILSGYLITKILLAEKDKHLTIRHKLKNFWVRRALRILPLSYLYLIILFVFSFFSQIQFNAGAELPYLLTYTYNFYLISVFDQAAPSFLTGHLWSLSIEEQFYIFFPLLIFFNSGNRLKIILIGLILFSVLSRLFYDRFPHYHLNGVDYSSFLDYHLFAYLGSFSFGASIFIFRLEKLRPFVGFVIFTISALIMLIGGLAVYLDLYKNEPFDLQKYLSSFGLVTEYSKNFYGIWGHFSLNLFYTSILLLLLMPGKNIIHVSVKKFFEIKPLVAIGKVSYGMYIFHAVVIWFFLQVFEQESINKYLFFLLCLLATWMVSFVAYHLFEKKFLALKEKFRSGDEKATAIVEGRSSVAS